MAKDNEMSAGFWYVLGVAMFASIGTVLYVSDPLIDLHSFVLILIDNRDLILASLLRVSILHTAPMRKVSQIE